MKDGQLTKLEIRAFKDKKLTNPADPASFVVPINPETFSRSLEVKYEENTAQGSQGTDAKYTSTEQEDIKLDFVLDATNTMMGYDPSQKNKSVPQQIDELLRTAYYMNGDIHKPHYLKILWGKHFTFDCVLTKLDINYTLFHPNGEPLRAKISATFKGSVEQDKRVRTQDKNSPDLTHVRQVKGGQKFPLMAFEIYGDQKYYLQAARANNLTSFRNVGEGREIVFPPLEK
jgi:hypothetical protein